MQPEGVVTERWSASKLPELGIEARQPIPAVVVGYGQKVPARLLQGEVALDLVAERAGADKVLGVVRATRAPGQNVVMRGAPGCDRWMSVSSLPVGVIRKHLAEVVGYEAQDLRGNDSAAAVATAEAVALVHRRDHSLRRVGAHGHDARFIGDRAQRSLGSVHVACHKRRDHIFEMLGIVVGLRASHGRAAMVQRRGWAGEVLVPQHDFDADK